MGAIKTLRRRPVQAAAIQWDGGDLRGLAFFLCRSNSGKVETSVNRDNDHLTIRTDTGVYEASCSDWICISSCGQIIILTHGQFLAEWEEV